MEIPPMKKQFTGAKIRFNTPKWICVGLLMMQIVIVQLIL